VRGRSTACFFSTDGLCRDVDAGVLVMYTSLPVGEEFSSVFTCFPLLGVCVCEKWCGVACTFYSLFFFLFFLLLFLFCISHGPTTVSFPKILYISRPHR